MASLTVQVVTELEETEVKASILGLFDSNALCSWSTVTADGQAHINACYFAPSQDFEFFVFTEPNSRHGQNVRDNPSSAVAVFDSRQPWGEDVYGIQCFGVARLLANEDAEHALGVYSARHPRMAGWAKSMSEVEASFKSRFYAIRIDSFTLLDYARFGAEVYVHGSVSR